MWIRGLAIREIISTYLINFRRNRGIRMIKYQKRLAQYMTILSLGPIGSIGEKQFMLKKIVPVVIIY